MEQALEQRTTRELKERLAELEVEFSDAAERFAEMHKLSDSIYTYCRADDAEDPTERFDLKGHLESWNDMIRLQEAGEYPADFSSIHCPVLMLHGTYDPHPGAMIRDSLEAYIPQLEYHELEKYGHSPWVEEHARDRFLVTARSWLLQRLR